MSTGARILIVEDDPEIQFALSSLLDMEGYSVFSANNGEEALRSLRSSELPDLILLDMIMPVMDGWEFAKNFRKEFGPETPFLVMSAAANAGDRARDVGAVDWVPKPFQLDDLLQRVARHSRK